MSSISIKKILEIIIRHGNVDLMSNGSRTVDRSILEHGTSDVHERSSNPTPSFHDKCFQHFTLNNHPSPPSKADAIGCSIHNKTAAHPRKE